MEPSKERFQKINDLKVSRMKLDNDNKQVKEKQYEMFGSQPFPNIYLTSMKGGGKTNLIAFIVKNLITSKTKLRIFSTTAHNDLTMKALLKKLDKYEFSYEIYENPFKNGVDILDEQFKQIQAQIDEPNNKEEYAKSKWAYPTYIYIYDDMTSLLRNSKGFDSLLCRNRHIRVINIISNQYWNQISPVARANINFILLFRNIADKKLEQIYDEKIGGRMSFDKFLEIYHLATSEKYNFLYVSEDGELRKNFDEKIVI